MPGMRSITYENDQLKSLTYTFYSNATRELVIDTLREELTELGNNRIQFRQHEVVTVGDQEIGQPWELRYLSEYINQETYVNFGLEPRWHPNFPVRIEALQDTADYAYQMDAQGRVVSFQMEHGPANERTQVSCKVSYE